MHQIHAARKILSRILGRRQGSSFYNAPHAYLKLPPIKAFTSPQFLSDPNGVSGKYDVAQSAPRMDVHILEFPESHGMGECWSCWGQGMLTAEGRLYFAAGNHLESGGAGNSHLYCYDTASGKLGLAVDVRRIVPDPNVAAGKIHGTIGEGNDGRIYFLTYRGAENEETASADFKGSALLSFDPQSGETASLGIPCEGQVFRAAVMDSNRMLLCLVGLPSRSFLCYDIAGRSLLYRSPAGWHIDDRHLFPISTGDVLLSFDEGELGIFKLPERRIHKLGRSLRPKFLQRLLNLLHPKPAPFLRCMAAVPDGRMSYGISGSGQVFSLDMVSHELCMLRNSFAVGEYVASLAISRDGRFLYYVPGSLGNAANLGVPIVQYNIASGQLKVLAFLALPFLRQFEYRIGGCYSISVDNEGKTLFMVFNGTPLRKNTPVDQQPPFGQPCLVVLNIPDSERC